MEIVDKLASYLAASPWQMWASFVILAAAIAAFASERFSMELVSIATVAVFLVLFEAAPLVPQGGGEAITTSTILEGFADPALLAIMCLLMLSQGLFQSGAMEWPTRYLVNAPARVKKPVLVLVLLLALFASSFVNDTPVVVMFLPIVAAIAASSRIAPSRVMMPLSYFALLGGMTTLIGSSTNILAAGVYYKATGAEIAFFDLTPMGAMIAGVMAAHLRRLGYPARSQTNADSDILQIPPTLMAGLGELSRIGELVLSPFVGPRFKTVVLTTSLPLEVDRPVDFGLQDFCAKCTKCARECPCMAIPFGPKVMFNGYEMWKPDVEKCAKYRVTNMKGSACGRCMKTCPYNTEGLLAHRFFLWLAIHVPASRGWIARLDDKVANGAINGTKKWWFDLEMVDGVSVTPKGVNARGLDFAAVKRASTQALALFPPEVSPPPAAQAACEPDRAAGIKAYAAAETPAAARSRSGRS